MAITILAFLVSAVLNTVGFLLISIVVVFVKISLDMDPRLARIVDVLQWSGGNFIVFFLSINLTLRAFSKNYSKELPNRLFRMWIGFLALSLPILLTSPIILEYGISDILRRITQLSFAVLGLVLGRNYFLDSLLDNGDTT